MNEPKAPQVPALIVGLGNPGREFARHRHNIGFQVVESLAQSHGLIFTRQKKMKAYVAAGPGLPGDTPEEKQP